MTALSRMNEPALEQGSRLRPPYASVLDLIGADAGRRADQIRHRPLPAVHQAGKPESGRLDQGPHRAVDDRRCRAHGRLAPGGTIVEATAGNTGLGLAQVGIPKGYRIVLVVPDKMSREKIQHLRALGAEVRMTRSDVGKGHPEYYQDMAEKIAAEIARRLLRQPVRQSGQSAGARDHDRPGDLGAARRATSTRSSSASARAAR